MSQEPWPCNGEDPWLSSKGHTIGVGKAVLGRHGTSSIVWSENGPCWGTIAYFVGGKRGEDLVSYNMSQTLPIQENYLVVFINIILHGLYSKIRLEIRPGICPTDRKKNLKNHGLPEFASGPPLGGRPDVNSGRPWNLIHSPPCRTPCRLFIHEVFFGPLGLHLRVWSELGQSPPFRPMRALTLQWSWAFSLVCELWSGPWLMRTGYNMSSGSVGVYVGENRQLVRNEPVEFER